jgi:hypothetical protein
MNITTRYHINDAEIIHEIIDGEVMLLNLTNGNYFSLDNIGVIIWEMISFNYSIEVLIEAIGGFDTSKKNSMEAAIRQVVAQMIEEGLIIPFEDDALFNQTDIIKSIDSRLRDGSIQFIVPVLHMYKDIQEKYAHPAGVKAV